MNSEIKEKLDALVGKTKIYKNKEIVIKSFKEINNTIVVITNAHSHAFKNSEINLFFNDLKDPSDMNNQKLSFEPKIKESSEVAASPKTNEIVINGYQPSEENKTLKSSLLDVLLDLKNNPSEETFQKSKEICNVANTMVNIQKAEIQLINAVKR
jgi:hypothetical protein